jgi:hypothetical protein
LQAPFGYGGWQVLLLSLLDQQLRKTSRQHIRLQLVSGKVRPFGKRLKTLQHPYLASKNCRGWCVGENLVVKSLITFFA